MTILIKLGGSLITDKTRAKTFRRDNLRRVVRQIVRLQQLDADIRIIIGHGSGSFGHFEARKYSTATGVHTDRERLGFVKVGSVAAELSLLVQNEFLAAGLPTMRFQPSSMIISRDRRITTFDSRALSLALDQRLIPLIHGDIALDEAIGGTIISTESLFAHLVQKMDVDQIILLGEVDGVLDASGDVIPQITPTSFEKFRSALAGSPGVDVTGGMLQKVESMIALVRERPTLVAIIANGRHDDILVDLLTKRARIGTRIRAESATDLPE